MGDKSCSYVGKIINSIGYVPVSAMVNMKWELWIILHCRLLGHRKEKDRAIVTARSFSLRFCTLFLFTPLSQIFGYELLKPRRRSIALLKR